MITWYLCDLQSGNVINELPLRASAELERTVGVATSLGVTLDVHDPSCPANWAYAIDPLRAMIVCVNDDQPTVGYFIDNDEAGTPSAIMTLTSLEGILDNVFVRSYDFYEGTDDEADVMAALLSDVVGPSFGFDVDVTPTGHSADHSYLFEEDRTVLSAFNDLMAAENGPEWTVRLRWEDSTHSRIIKTIHVGPQIGNVIASTVFENKHLVQRTRKRASGSGNRATYVIATSDGSGDSRPMSTPAVDEDALAAGVPQWEARVSFTAIDDDAQLDRLASAALARRHQCVTTWEMQLALSERGCPRLIKDFDAGDTVGIQSEPTKNDPLSWLGTARVIGWRAAIAGREFSTVTPAFWSPPEESVA